MAWRILICQDCCTFLAKPEVCLKPDCPVCLFAGLEQTGEQYGWMLELATAEIAAIILFTFCNICGNFQVWISGRFNSDGCILFEKTLSKIHLWPGNWLIRRAGTLCGVRVDFTGSSWVLSSCKHKGIYINNEVYHTILHMFYILVLDNSWHQTIYGLT